MFEAPPSYAFKNVSRLAVLRALPGLGDFLCATPALRALRAGLPHAHITLIGLPWLDFLSPRYRLWDAFLPFPGAPGLPEPFDLERFKAFMRTHRGRFDAALQLHGSGPQSNAFISELGAPLSAGFYSSLETRSGPRFLPWFLPWNEDEREVTRWLRLLEHLGVPAQGTALSFPLRRADLGRADLLKREHGVEKPYLILHPGAASELKRWPVERFAEVGRAVQRLGVQVIITGSAGEAELAERLERQLPGALNLCKETDIGTLAALLQGARLLVCNDTGVSHLAAATRTPSVVVFSETDPARWAPLDASRHIAVQTTPENPSTETVLAAMHTLLGGDREYSDLARPRGVPLLPDAR